MVVTASFAWSIRVPIRWHYAVASAIRFLQDQRFPYTLVSPLHLKKSLGITRGKNDRPASRRVDAQRIAQFACLHQRSLKPMQLPSACLLKPGAGALKNLMAFRDRLTKTKRGRPAVSLKQTIADLKDTASLVDNSFIIKQSEKQLKLVQQQIAYTAPRGTINRWRLPYRRTNRYKNTSA